MMYPGLATEPWDNSEVKKVIGGLPFFNCVWWPVLAFGWTLPCFVFKWLRSWYFFMFCTRHDILWSACFALEEIQYLSKSRECQLLSAQSFCWAPATVCHYEAAILPVFKTPCKLQTLCLKLWQISEKYQAIKIRIAWWDQSVETDLPFSHVGFGGLIEVPIQI